MADVDAGAVAPVVNAPAADAVQAPDAPTGQEQAPIEESVKPEPKYTEEDARKLISERLSKERRRIEKTVRAELERDFYKHQLETAQKPQPQAAGKPTPEQFAGNPNPYAYLEALTEWMADQKAEAKISKLRQETESQFRARQQEDQARGMAQKLSEGAKKYSDFQEVALADDVPNTAAMAHAIAKLSNGADVAYYLGSNTDEAAQIAGMSDIEQVWAIKDLSTKLSSAAPTKAPAPIKPNSGSGKSGGGYHPDMTDKEFADWRKRQIAQKR